MRLAQTVTWPTDDIDIFQCNHSYANSKILIIVLGLKRDAYRTLRILYMSNIHAKFKHDCIPIKFLRHVT
jgi:hypothetical protein